MSGSEMKLEVAFPPPFYLFPKYKLMFHRGVVVPVASPSTSMQRTNFVEGVFQNAISEQEQRICCKGKN